jgi:hypothetical protein
MGIVNLVLSVNAGSDIREMRITILPIQSVQVSPMKDATGASMAAW